LVARNLSARVVVVKLLIKIIQKEIEPATLAGSSSFAFDLLSSAIVRTKTKLEGRRPTLTHVQLGILSQGHINYCITSLNQ
jgi:hypothetical protein